MSICFIDSQENIHSSFADLFNPIERRFPYDYFKLWNKELFKPEKIEAIELDNFCEAYKKMYHKFKQDEKELKAYCWSNVMLFFSFYKLWNRLNDLSYNDYDKVPRSITSEDNFDYKDVLLTKLNTLYYEWLQLENEEPSARPYAFYRLIKTILEDPALKDYLKKNINSSLEIFDYLKFWWDNRSNHDNHLIDFVRRYRNNGGLLGKPNTNSNYETIRLYQSITKKIGLSNKDKHQCKNKKQVVSLVIGLSGNGKTTFVKEIYNGVNSNKFVDENRIYIEQLIVTELPENISNDIEDFTKPGRPRPTLGDKWGLEGQFVVNNEADDPVYNIRERNYDYSLQDTRGGLLDTVPPREDATELGALEKVLLDTDQLIILVDPSLMSDKIRLENFFNNIIGRLAFLFRNNKHPMISIVLSKFDEYGVIFSGARRLIKNKEQVNHLANWASSNHRSDWKAFVNSVKRTLPAETHPALPEMIQIIFDKLNPLFWGICGPARRHFALNVYMLSIPEAERNMIPVEQTGIVEIFKDFGIYYAQVSKTWLPYYQIKNKKKLTYSIVTIVVVLVVFILILDFI